jgi:hypothetical protein
VAVLVERDVDGVEGHLVHEEQHFDLRLLVLDLRSRAHAQA